MSEGTWRNKIQYEYTSKVLKTSDNTKGILILLNRRKIVNDVFFVVRHDYGESLYRWEVVSSCSPRIKYRVNVLDDIREFFPQTFLESKFKVDKKTDYYPVIGKVN